MIEIIGKQFNGYPLDFYSGIPYEETDDDAGAFYDFRERALAMPTDFADIGKFYEECGLPMKKLMRRLFFAKPVLFFWLPEIRSLPFRNYDLFCEHLAGNMMLIILAQLYAFNGIPEFLQVLIERFGEGKAWRKAEGLGFSLGQVAAFWHMGKEAVKESVIDDIDRAEGQEIMMYDGYGAGARKIAKRFNFPFSFSPAELEREGRIGKYDFRLIKSSSELSRAASVLHNCLDGYLERMLLEGSMVYLICEEETIKAAIEMDTICGSCVNLVKQVSLARNENIEHDVPVNMAFQIWFKKNNLLQLGYEHRQRIEEVWRRLNDDEQDARERLPF
jgi:hypothetical protein